ncbi:putative mitochondrial chaperone BCS1-A [Psilocybe cubensis]|uniref:Mitochondrial chaperone BCS1-A n=1 Tax=Psilocybe cubensis TaxID=181762 RepID=A0ACB8GMH7_PSICU|nr:putative mitochondrial chaperone BCS1-A [Psilocybe cubensis]KAH9476761.1 putative mitochondrial chaperone BCS1-A [Psilocybe cubensis]
MSFDVADTSGQSWFGPASLLQGMGTKLESIGNAAGGSNSYFGNKYSITAHFSEGDPAYDWIILFLTEEKVWTRSRQFQVNAASSLRQWTVNLASNPKPGGHVDEHAEYVPTYDEPQLFRWRGYWAEIRRSGSQKNQANYNAFIMDGSGSLGKLSLTLYTRDMSALSALVDDARKKYMATSRPHVIVHSADQAGELGLEIYSLALSSNMLDDAMLARLVSSIPKQAIILIEDIDCAFPSREDQENEESSMRGMMMGMNMMGMNRRAMNMARPGSAVTLSGLLNVLDGVGSEEGKLFFATTNYVERLDQALLRPGRIDVKIPYQLATQEQAAALFVRFYPDDELTVDAGLDIEKKSLPDFAKPLDIPALAERFASFVPQHEFSTAELQGFLLSCKNDPLRAADEVGAWVEREKKDKLERLKREAEEKEKKEEKKEAHETKRLRGGLARLGVSVGGQEPKFEALPYLNSTVTPQHRAKVDDKPDANGAAMDQYHAEASTSKVSQVVDPNGSTLL